MKQAVIAPSMLALLYPLDDEVPGYSREQLRGRPRQRVREGHQAGVRRGRRASVHRLHRGPPGHPGRSAQPVDRARHAAALHRAQQPGAGPVQPRGAIERSASTPARAATATRCTAPTSTTTTCCRACSCMNAGYFLIQLLERAGQGLRLRADRPAPPRGRGRRAAVRLHRRDQPAEPAGGERRGGARRAGRGRRTSSRRNASARPTTAASRRSASTRSPTTVPRTTHGTSRSRRSRTGCRAPGSPRRSSAWADAGQAPAQLGAGVTPGGAPAQLTPVLRPRSRAAGARLFPWRGPRPRCRPRERP